LGTTASRKVAKKKRLTGGNRGNREDEAAEAFHALIHSLGSLCSLLFNVFFAPLREAVLGSESAILAQGGAGRNAPMAASD
jgi:hypothetical protein